MQTRDKNTAPKRLASEQRGMDPVDTVFTAELDSVTLAVFVEEAQDILASSRQLLEQLVLAPHNKATILALQYDLEMLAGGAELIQLQAIVTLANELEWLYAGLLDVRYSCNEALVSLLFRSYDGLELLLTQLQSDVALTSIEDIIFRLRTYRAAQAEIFLQRTTDDDTAASASQRPNYSALSPGQTYLSVRAPELIAVFLEEGFDIINNATSALLSWMAQPDAPIELERLQRYLHTLKGNARMVQITPMGDLAHKLEFLYEDLRTGLFQADQSVLELLCECHDTLVTMLEAVRDEIVLPDAQHLIERIQYLRAEQIQLNPLTSALHMRTEASSLPEQATTQLLLDKAQQAESRAHLQRFSSDSVRVPAHVLEELLQLADQTAVFRQHIYQHVDDFGYLLKDMSGTVEQMREQLQRLDAQIERTLINADSTPHTTDAIELEPLKMDCYAHLQQLSRTLFASSSDLLGLQNHLSVQHADTQTLLLQKGQLNTQLRDSLMRTRWVAFEHIVPRLQRCVDHVSVELGKKVDLMVTNAQAQLDRGVLERLLAPLEHMLRNALDHGIESADIRQTIGKAQTGCIHLELREEGEHTVLIVSDDGAGIDLAAVRAKALEQQLLAGDEPLCDQAVMHLIMQAGLSTAEAVTQISGRGFGMDVVATELQHLGASLQIDSQWGQGTQFYIRLPLKHSLRSDALASAMETTTPAL